MNEPDLQAMLLAHHVALSILFHSSPASRDLLAKHLETAEALMLFRDIPDNVRNEALRQLRNLLPSSPTPGQ